MPSSVEDRTTVAHESLFLLTPGPNYFYDFLAVRQPGASSEDTDINLRSVWTLTTEPLGLMMCTGCKEIYRKQAFKKLDRTGSGFRDRRCVCGQVNWLEHFAAFPSEIPKRAISLGTPSAGVCKACLAPKMRIFEREKVERDRPNEWTKHDGEEGTGNSIPNTVAGVKYRTIGWEFSCDCGAEAIPATVCDPFSGSGTSGMVATELGRYYIGCELNPDYGVLNRYRINSWRHREAAPAIVAITGQRNLF